MGRHLAILDSRFRGNDDAISALRDLKKPIGVAAWRTRLVESLPKRLAGQLPTVEEIERELKTVKPTSRPTSGEQP